MRNFQNVLQNTVIALFVGALFAFLWTYYQGYDASIGWSSTTSAEPKEFQALPFSKGPFQFSFDAKTYNLTEVFAAGPITRYVGRDAWFTGAILLGICLLLTSITYLSRYAFIAVMIGFIFFLLNLHLPEVEIFGFDQQSSGGVILLLLAYLLPAYLFHAFLPNSKLVWRLFTFIVITASIVFFSSTNLIALQEQFVTGSYTGLMILTLFLLFIIAEEVLFGILILITRSRGGKNNHIHFLIFSVAYLAIVGLHYAHKSGYHLARIDFFDPYLLFALSCGICFWTLKFKTDYFPNLSLFHLRLLFGSIVIIVLTFLAYAFYRGNDPVYEGLHYLIVYAHLGFGFFFLFYVLLNFITPLIEGSQVYKIVFKEQNFPYVSAKLGGIAAVVAFFFLSEKEPLFMIRAGHFNYLGAQAEMQNNSLLAEEYFEEGSIFGRSNHFSNYQLGYAALRRNHMEQALYRFHQASLRFPSPQSFINYSGALANSGESTPSLVNLQDGLRLFPGNDYLQNNLGLAYAELGRTEEAAGLLEEAAFKSNWTNAGMINLWKVKPGNTEKAAEDFNEGNLAVKANVLQALISQGASAPISFDTTSLHSAYPLHRQVYLINAAGYFADPEVPVQLEKSLSGLVDEGVFQTGKNAAALSYYKSGAINQAITLLNSLLPEANASNRALYANELGLIAISQNCPALALNYFEDAVQHGSVPALLNKEACLMELHQYEEALIWAQELVSLDTLYIPIATDLSAIIQKTNLTPDQQRTRLYYIYTEYTPAEMTRLLKDASMEFISSLWQKISSEELLKENYNDLKAYKTTFGTFLNPTDLEEPDALIALHEGAVPTGDYPLVKALSISDPSKKKAALILLGKQNALNEPLEMAITDLLYQEDHTAAYEILVEALQINPMSIPMTKKYILYSLKMGLHDYAENALNKLRALTSPEDYSSFEKVYNATVRERKKTDWNNN